jgi:pantoate--beta-alanine ligase
MQIISAISELRSHLRGKEGIAFVPTMGNLHEGHIDLMRIARQQGKLVVASIYVNPLQFGENEDYGNYPRTLQNDCEKLEQCGVDVLFTPTDAELYSQPQEVTVVPPLENDLCGAFRPGHFRGVATVVLKLFNIVQPELAVFGKKDCQQLHVIRQLVIQLNLPIKIIGGETVRAQNGLALSSRNQYLNQAELIEAVVLYQTLVAMRQSVLDGARDFTSIEQRAARLLSARGWQVDYVAVRAQTSLLPPDSNERNLVILAAARLGKARLIDNLEIRLQ